MLDDNHVNRLPLPSNRQNWMNEQKKVGKKNFIRCWFKWWSRLCHVILFNGFGSGAENHACVLNLICDYRGEFLLQRWWNDTIICHIEKYAAWKDSPNSNGIQFSVDVWELFGDTLKAFGSQTPYTQFVFWPKALLIWL